MCVRDDSRADSLLRPDTVLQSRYRIGRQLGRGGMGAVYEALDLRLGHTVALKQSLTDDPRMWKHFEREARLLAHLNHPVLPRVTDYFIETGRAFFVMQFVEGHDLATLLAEQPGPLPPHAVVAWADQLLDAIIYLHSHDRQIIHRDIKPHNLKVTPNGKIALLDFGLAKSQINREGDTSQSIYGYSPRYAPLEQINDTGTGPQSDIYALGATLYHLLTGVKPADATARVTALITSQPNPMLAAHEVNPAVEVELSMILSRAMASDPDERYRTANEFREALRRLGRIDDFAKTKDDGIYCDSDLLMSPPSRLASHALAALFLILLASFGVFCHYYRWRMPDRPMPAIADSNSNRSAPPKSPPEAPTKLQSSRNEMPQKKRRTSR